MELLNHFIKSSTVACKRVAYKKNLVYYEIICTNNYLLLRDKTIYSLLELINHVLTISEYVLEKHHEKHPQSAAQITM